MRKMNEETLFRWLEEKGAKLQGICNARNKYRDEMDFKYKLQEAIQDINELWELIKEKKGW